MKHITLADTKHIAGMFIGREYLCQLIQPDYSHYVDSWELVYVPLTPRPITPIPATPPTH